MSSSHSFAIDNTWLEVKRDVRSGSRQRGRDSLAVSQDERSLDCFALEIKSTRLIDVTLEWRLARIGEL
ncbi:hypothetical protein Bpfe_023189, partial [Biomphalaria pfeifferi]